MSLIPAIKRLFHYAPNYLQRLKNIIVRRTKTKKHKINRTSKLYANPIAKRFESFLTTQIGPIFIKKFSK